MSKVVMVIPYVYEPYMKACMETLSLPDEFILEPIDNTQENKGVAGSWNIGIDSLRENNAGWLIVCTAAMRFGKNAGWQMLEAFRRHPAANVVTFAERGVKPSQFVRGKSLGLDAGIFSWHLCAVNRKTIEDVGKFDANFYPSYFEDLDYDIRVNKRYGKKVDWPIEPIDARGTTVGHAVKLGGVTTPVNDLIAYFATKWGRHPSAAQLGEYSRPFNDKNNSLAFWPPAHGQVWNE